MGLFEYLFAMAKNDAENQQNIGILIRRALKSSRMTQKHLAERLGIHPSQLCVFLNGKSDVGAERFVQILMELGIPLRSVIESTLVNLANQKTNADFRPEEIVKNLNTTATDQLLLHLLKSKSKI